MIVRNHLAFQQRRFLREHEMQASLAPSVITSHGEVSERSRFTQISTPIKVDESRTLISTPKQRSRAPLRDVVLEELHKVHPSPTGSKAASIRDYIESVFGERLHEKTVGMTLYRLSKENLAHRKGRNWFFGPSSAETKNPGLQPGSLNAQQE